MGRVDQHAVGTHAQAFFLDAALQAYERWLGYQVVARGTIPPELATAWNSPATSGRRYVLMQPASGWRTYLRLVESPPTPGYAAMRTHGWNANEILVQDPDALAAQFATFPHSGASAKRALEMEGERKKNRFRNRNHQQ